MSDTTPAPTADLPTPAPVATEVPTALPQVTETAAAPAAAEASNAAPAKPAPRKAAPAAAKPVPAAPAPAAKPARRGRPAKTAPAAKALAAPAVAPKSPAPKSPAVVARPRRVVKPVTRAATAKVAAKLKSPSTPTPKAAKPVAALPKSKDKPMANTPIDFTAAFKSTFADLQEKAKTAYEKSTSAFGEANEFAKGNVEALVESGKILASGLQELGTALTTESRSAFETLTAEAKDLAAVKSPTEFFQLQSTLLRKQFDSAVAQTSKNTEAVIKLASEAFSPISNRITLAVEKASKAA